jgi:LmbE family N-acetylglucosaminyl deacetylase
MTPAMQSKAVYAFLFAHPDDDAFISGTMRTLVQNGAKVHGVWLTSGDRFGKASARENELFRAVKHVGLEPAQVHLLRLPDLGLVREMDRAADTVTRLLHDVQPEIVFCNAFEGGHPDHDAVNFLTYEGCLRSNVQARLYEFPLYSGAGRRVHFRWLINSFPKDDSAVLRTNLSESAYRCRIRVLQSYPSQWMFMFPLRLASSRSRMRTIGEPYRSCPPERDHTIPPHPGQLNYERWFNSFMKIGFNDFRASVIRTRQTRPA